MVKELPLGQKECGAADVLQEALNEHARMMKTVLAEAFVQSFGPMQKAMDEFEATLEAAAKEIGEWLEALPKVSRFVFDGLCKRGWYPSDTMSAPMINELAALLKAEDHVAVDTAMATYVASEVASIREQATKQFLSRARVLRSAFSAHVQRRYTLAIPVFLAQADGICLDLLGTKFFSVDRRNNKPRTAEKVKGREWNPLHASLFSPLEIVGGLAMGRDTAGRLRPPLNRHEVLHGLDTVYGNRLNSLRCISLIGFLASIVADEFATKEPAREGS